MATSPRLSIDNELSPQEVSVATLCQVSRRQWPDLFTIISSPRKFVECLYCNVDPLPILLVLSRVVESIYHIQYIHSYKLHSYIHISIHQYFHIHIYTHSCIHIIYTTSIHTWLHQSSRVLFGRIPSVQSSIVSSG